MMKLLGLTLVAAAIVRVSAEPQIDFKHYSMEGCSKNGGTQIGDVDHLEANKDVKNFDDDGQPVFHSFSLHFTDDEDELEGKFCEIVVCTQYDCEKGHRMSAGDIKNYSNNQCVDNPGHLPGRAVDFTCRDKAAATHTGTSTFSDSTRNAKAKETTTTTTTVTRDRADKTTHSTSHTLHQMREVTLKPERPHICDVCDNWWWDPHPDALRV